MKTNKIERHGRRTKIFIGLVVAIAATVVSLAIGYDRLRNIYLEQCIIEDMASQVSIVSGKMVHPSNIAEVFGLKRGANLALIDFRARREKALSEIPNLREITITRQMPNRVTIVAEERTPIAKMGLHGSRKATGKVVDSEGMVFLCQRGTQLLPTIYEPRAPGTQKGCRLTGRAKAALRLVETCREPEFQELGLQDADISKPDYILMTLSDYSIAKIVWNDMDEPSSDDRKDLENRLRRLIQTIRTQIGTGVKIWNATMPNMIFADTQERH